MPTYVSAQGLQSLKDELEKRSRESRREIAEKINAAKELGDLSENFEYHEAKEQQGLNEARILQLEEMIRDAVIVEESLGNDVIDMGASFVVSAGAVKKEYSLVGSSEADPIVGKISNESPLGKAFLGRKAGDSVEIQTPSGAIVYKIERIK